MVSFCVLQNVTFSSFLLMSFFSKLRHTFWSHIKAYSALKVPLNPCRSISVYCHWHNKRWWWFLLENILLKGVFLKLILTSKIVRIELQLFGEEIVTTPCVYLIAAGSSSDDRWETAAHDAGGTVTSAESGMLSLYYHRYFSYICCNFSNTSQNKLSQWYCA